MAKTSWAERRFSAKKQVLKASDKRTSAALDTYRDLTDAEKHKVARNVKDGYKPLKGLRDGFCNRYACQDPIGKNPSRLRPDSQYAFMTDHEGNGLDRLYYCIPCSRMFNDVDEGDRRRGESTRPNRISYEEITE